MHMKIIEVKRFEALPADACGSMLLDKLNSPTLIKAEIATAAKGSAVSKKVFTLACSSEKYSTNLLYGFMGGGGEASNSRCNMDLPESSVAQSNMMSNP